MSNRLICISMIATLSALALSGPTQAQQDARLNFGGDYRCEPDPSPCPWPGQTLSIAQSGANLELKNQQATFADGKVTSDITVSVGPTLNSIGIVLPDNSIEWSNGTRWRRQ